MGAHAESAFTTGNTANITATARVDFSVTIPKFVFLQVGTGTNMATNAAIDVITFSVGAAAVGNGTAVAGTGGDQTNGKVTLRVRGNNGDMTLAATGPATLLSGTDQIAWTQITVVAANGAPAHPAVGGAAVTLPATGKVVNIPNGDWTYAYANAAVVPAGTYTGRVTYTATTP